MAGGNGATRTLVTRTPNELTGSADRSTPHPADRFICHCGRRQPWLAQLVRVDVSAGASIAFDGLLSN